GTAIASPPSRSWCWTSSTSSVSSASRAASSSAANAFSVGPYQSRKNETKCSAERKRNVNVRSLKVSSETLSAKSERRCCSVPHSIGEGTPAGGGTCFETVRK